LRLGIIGLGRMGGNMARRLRAASIDVVGWTRDQRDVDALAEEIGMIPASSLAGVVEALSPPRVVWLMLPSGDVTHEHIAALGDRLEPGDIVVDGANSHYRDSIAHGSALGERGISFVDAGVSGGVWGLSEGYALMVGGPSDAIKVIEPVLKALAPAPDRGWLHCGLTGSGHFVKMVHNGIEYGMMQAYAEGFSLLEARKDFDLDLAAVAEMWRHGSVVRSWLLDLTVDVLRNDARFDDIAPYVADSGEGRWTAIEAVERGIPAPVISTALMMRFASQGNLDYGSKLLAMMRNRFGGHAVSSEPSLSPTRAAGEATSPATRGSEPTS
jgi:6-phosphogluconate dehydrogenase